MASEPLRGTTNTPEAWANAGTRDASHAGQGARGRALGAAASASAPTNRRMSGARDDVARRVACGFVEPGHREVRTGH